MKLVFLGKLADLAGVSEREIAAGSSLGWQDLLAMLDSSLADEISCERVKLALNGAIVTDKTGLTISDGDELAFLPPVSGG